MVVKVLAESEPHEVRFAGLRRRVTGISPKVLAQTLRDLECDGLVGRRVEPTAPPRVHYGLTDRGRELEIVLRLLRDRAEEHMPAVNRSRASFDERNG